MAATFQLPENPGARGFVEEWADYWELTCLGQEGQPLGSRNIFSPVAVSDDEEDIRGIDEEEDEMDDRFITFLDELKQRKDFFSGYYPFGVSTNSLTYTGCSQDVHYIYLFLLLTTRSNMNRFRTMNGIDGTLVFEELCKVVLERFFGNQSKCLLFGTSSTESFRSKVERLIEESGVGVRFDNHGHDYTSIKDDSIDIVTFINFHDKMESKFMAFGQCKTGVNWHDGIFKLQSSEFTKKWFYDQPTFTPIRVVMLSEDFTRRHSKRVQMSHDALFFTRFRLLEFLTEPIEEAVLSKIIRWVEGRLALPLF